MIDVVIPEPAGGAQAAPALAIAAVDQIIGQQLSQLKSKRGVALAASRYQKFRRMGTVERRSSERN